MYGKNELLYPQFIECIQFTKDIFWKNIFKDLSYGKCPYGVYITNNFICCNYKDKKFSYKISLNTDYEKIYKDIYDIFKNKFGLLSNKDKIQNNKQIIDIETEMSDIITKDSWVDIKKKNIKVLLIQQYIINKGKLFSLQPQQIKDVYNKIIIGLLLKTINKNDIVYSNSSIQDISCLKFCRHSYSFNNTDIYDIKSKLIFI